MRGLSADCGELHGQAQLQKEKDKRAAEQQRLKVLASSAPGEAPPRWCDAVAGSGYRRSAFDQFQVGRKQNMRGAFRQLAAVSRVKRIGLRYQSLVVRSQPWSGLNLWKRWKLRKLLRMLKQTKSCIQLSLRRWPYCADSWRFSAVKRFTDRGAGTRTCGSQSSCDMQNQGGVASPSTMACETTAFNEIDTPAEERNSAAGKANPKCEWFSLCDDEEAA
eukprot:Skav232600  [mRNA]  locus=scaffold2282:15721:22555:+ [translate_table: standard]